MFVSAKRQWFLPARFSPERLKLGEKFDIDSGMGGGYTVTFTEVRVEGRYPHRREKLVFKIVEHWDTIKGREFAFDRAEAHQHLYICVPENRWFFDIWKEENPRADYDLFAGAN